MRNLPFDVYINALAARHVPAYRFAGSTEAGWRDRAARLFALRARSPTDWTANGTVASSGLGTPG
jgi:hypothetical protein